MFKSRPSAQFPIQVPDPRKFDQVHLNSLFLVFLLPIRPVTAKRRRVRLTSPQSESINLSKTHFTILPFYHFTISAFKHLSIYHLHLLLFKCQFPLEDLPLRTNEKAAPSSPKSSDKRSKRPSTSSTQTAPAASTPKNSKSPCGPWASNPARRR